MKRIFAASFVAASAALLPGIAHADWQRLTETPENFFDFAVGNGEICYIYYRGCNTPSGGYDCDGGSLQCSDSNGTYTTLGQLPDLQPSWNNSGYPVALTLGKRVGYGAGHSEIFVATSAGSVFIVHPPTSAGGAWSTGGLDPWSDTAGLHSENLPSRGGQPNGLDSSGSLCGPTECRYGALKLAYEFFSVSGTSVPDCAGTAAAGPLFMLGNNGHVYQEMCGARGTTWADTGLTNIVQISYSWVTSTMEAVASDGREWYWNDPATPGAGTWTAWAQDPGPNFYVYPQVISAGGAAAVGGYFSAGANGSAVDFRGGGVSLDVSYEFPGIDAAFAAFDGNPPSTIISMQEGGAWATGGARAVGPSLGSKPSGSDVFWVLASDLRIYAYFNQ